MSRIEHKGNAKATNLTADLGGTATDLTIPGTDFTGYPDGTIGTFYITIDRDLPTQEKILCATRTGNVITVATGGRGADDTPIQFHATNAVIEHVWTAIEADEANAHIESVTTAHGIANTADLVTLSGVQHVTGVKTMDTPILTAPVATGGTHTGASHVSVAGAQVEAEFRVRNVYIGTGDPSNTIGEDGDMYISKTV